VRSPRTANGVLNSGTKIAGKKKSTEGCLGEDGDSNASLMLVRERGKISLRHRPHKRNDVQLGKGVIAIVLKSRQEEWRGGETVEEKRWTQRRGKTESRCKRFKTMGGEKFGGSQKKSSQPEKAGGGETSKPSFAFTWRSW